MSAYLYYLSGPMSGLPDYNYPAFDEAAERIRYWAASQQPGGLTPPGHRLLFNPTEQFDGDQGQPFATYLRHDVDQLLRVKLGLIVLPGWEDAAGAVLEVAVAVAIGLPVWMYHDDDLESMPMLYEGGDRDELCEVLATPKPRNYLQEEIDRQVDEGYRRMAGSLIYTVAAPVSAKPVSNESVSNESVSNESVSNDGRSVLAQADEIVNGVRAATYDHPRRNFDRIARIWTAILGVDVTPTQTALCMIGVKLARLAHTPDHRDSVVDLAGYAATIERLWEPIE